VCVCVGDTALSDCQDVRVICERVLQLLTSLTQVIRIIRISLINYAFK